MFWWNLNIVVSVLRVQWQWLQDRQSGGIVCIENRYFEIDIQLDIKYKTWRWRLRLASRNLSFPLSVNTDEKKTLFINNEWRTMTESK